MKDGYTGSGFDVPILMILFNRPLHAKQVFDRVKQIRPTALYIAVDGPRETHVHESEKVNQCREIINQVDWPCEVHTLFRGTNLGCRLAVSSAITWFFNNVEYGIILEDDCVPDATFFSYCEDLLIRYQMDKNVMHIAGTNLLPSYKWNSDSYFFTKICLIWGWASWRRAWQSYDLDMENLLNDINNGLIETQVSDKESIKYWKQTFMDTYNLKIDTWDYQWIYSIWRNRGLCIIPECNLITNIGYDYSATHTKLNSPYAKMKTTPIFKVEHPSKVEENLFATSFLFNRLYHLPSKLTKLMNLNEMRFKRLKAALLNALRRSI